MFGFNRLALWLRFRFQLACRFLAVFGVDKRHLYVDDAHFSYVWHPNGKDKQGIFQIVLQIPGRRIAWRTMSNGFMSGVVSFEPRSERETEITLKIRSIFDPPNLSRRVEEYLHNFKRLVENEEIGR